MLKRKKKKRIRVARDLKDLVGLNIYYLLCIGMQATLHQNVIIILGWSFFLSMAQKKRACGVHERRGLTSQSKKLKKK